MKNWNIKSIVLITFALLMVTGTDAIAQRGNGAMARGRGIAQAGLNIPEITEDQSRQISELRLAHLKERQVLQSKLDVNRANYRALTIGDNPDMSAINANIDERSDILNQMEKKQAEHHQAVRGLLTDEQRVYFDSSRRMFAGLGQAAPLGRGARGAGISGNQPRVGRGVPGQGIMRNQPPFGRGM